MMPRSMAGIEVGSVYVGIAGGHITGLNSTGIIAVKTRKSPTREIDKVIDAARVVALPMDREVIHVLPQEFIVDDHDGILDPSGHVWGTDGGARPYRDSGGDVGP